MSPSVRRPNSEAADLAREQRALKESPNEEKVELAHIYEERGLKPKLAGQVAGQLMAKDALAAHARDELGFADGAAPKPIEAARASAVAFSVGAAMPTLAAYLSPRDAVVIVVPVAALVFLVALGALGAWAGGAPMVEASAQGRLLGRAGDGGDRGHRHADRQGRLALAKRALS